MQVQILGRRGTGQLSPRSARRPTRDLSDSSCGSLGSEGLSPTPTRLHMAADDTVSLAAPSLNSVSSLSAKTSALARCKSDQCPDGP